MKELSVAASLRQDSVGVYVSASVCNTLAVTHVHGNFGVMNDEA